MGGSGQCRPEGGRDGLTDVGTDGWTHGGTEGGREIRLTPFPQRERLRDRPRTPEEGRKRTPQRRKREREVGRERAQARERERESESERGWGWGNMMKIEQRSLKSKNIFTYQKEAEFPRFSFEWTRSESRLIVFKYRRAGPGAQCVGSSTWTQSFQAPGWCAGESRVHVGYLLAWPVTA